MLRIISWCKTQRRTSLQWVASAEKIARCRYTILDHSSALQRLMPLAVKKNVDVIVGGPYNSGVLVGGRHFEYGAVPPEIAEKVTTDDWRVRLHITDDSRESGGDG